MDIFHIFLKFIRLTLPFGKISGSPLPVFNGDRIIQKRFEVSPVRSADRTCPVRREIWGFSPGRDFGERVSAVRVILEYIADVAAIETHFDSCTSLSAVEYYKNFWGHPDRIFLCDSARTGKGPGESSDTPGWQLPMIPYDTRLFPMILCYRQAGAFVFAEY
jgi:hypothetical protein